MSVLGQLTSSELARQIEAVQDLLDQDEPDIMSPTLRAWVAALGKSLDDEQQTRNRLRIHNVNAPVPSARSPHDEA
jgi:hypothetical protein